MIEVPIPTDVLERLIALAEVGAHGIAAGPSRSSALVHVRCAESLLVTAKAHAQRQPTS